MAKFTNPSAPHDVGAPPIAANNLTVRYNSLPALEAITFQTPTGGRIAVVGPNGAGKTTLFKLVAGIIKPSEGQINIHGHPPGGHTCVAYVPQRSEVDWDFPVTVFDVVMMGRIREIGLFRWPRRIDRATVEQALDRVGLRDLSGRQIGDLSGGQQQRVFLAQAFAQEARIVLLDEPLSGLDLPSQEILLEILDDFKAEGVTVLVATHDLNLAD